MPKPVHRNVTEVGQRDPAPPMTADEAMDMLSAAVQHAVAFVMAAEAAQAAEVTAVQGSQSHERTARAKRPTT